jgi:hypothetical protein
MTVLIPFAQFSALHEEHAYDQAQSSLRTAAQPPQHPTTSQLVHLRGCAHHCCLCCALKQRDAMACHSLWLCSRATPAVVTLVIRHDAELHSTKKAKEQ